MVTIEKRLDENNVFPFSNNAFYCIGSGRYILTLRRQYYEQLKFLQEMIGFEHIRAHGIFCDEMGVYNEYQTPDGKIHTEYNFSYIDQAIDMFLELKIKPFLELGFMPGQLASGTATVCHWKGNVTPPKDYGRWGDLVRQLFLHLVGRYGREEVITWPVEVWNEPNLEGFWKDADLEAYLKLFRTTYHAIKEIDENIPVGGPALCGGETFKPWITAFYDFCQKENLKPAFLSRHHYLSLCPEVIGHYEYQELFPVAEFRRILEDTKALLQSFPEFADLPIHITEFSTSYSPRNPVHDTNQNAAILAGMLSWMGNMNASYSYWTFGDVFEESGVSFTPFSGGFGLIANGVIPKPTFWTFYFYKKLEGICIMKDDTMVITKSESGIYRGIIWNIADLHNGETLSVSLKFSSIHDSDEYFLAERCVDEETCNPLRTWYEMGMPPYPSSAQTELLKQAAQPSFRSSRLSGLHTLTFLVKPNGVLFFELEKVQPQNDRGFDYLRIAGK